MVENAAGAGRLTRDFRCKKKKNPKNPEKQNTKQRRPQHHPRLRRRRGCPARDRALVPRGAGRVHPAHGQVDLRVEEPPILLGRELTKKADSRSERGGERGSEPRWRRKRTREREKTFFFVFWSNSISPMAGCNLLLWPASLASASEYYKIVLVACVFYSLFPNEKKGKKGVAEIYLEQAAAARVAPLTPRRLPSCSPPSFCLSLLIPPRLAAAPRRSRALPSGGRQWRRTHHPPPLLLLLLLLPPLALALAFSASALSSTSCAALSLSRASIFAHPSIPTTR